MLSVIIITYNEADNIQRCLESVKWADEIIIVDSGSTDDTVKIAKRYTDKIHITKTWPGFGKQKAKALSYATQDWVLSIDADEVVSPELKAAIEKTMRDSKKDIVGFEVARKTIFDGKVIRYADALTHPLRLFQRAFGQFEPVPVHEKVMVKGQVGRLKQPLYHYSFKDVAHLIAKMNQYSSLIANEWIKSGKKSSTSKAIWHGIWMFVRVYFLRCGFLDGRAGLVLSMMRGAGSFYKHMKVAMAKQ